MSATRSSTRSSKSTRGNNQRSSRSTNSNSNSKTNQDSITHTSPDVNNRIRSISPDSSIDLNDQDEQREHDDDDDDTMDFNFNNHTNDLALAAFVSYNDGNNKSSGGNHASGNGNGEFTDFQFDTQAAGSIGSSTNQVNMAQGMNTATGNDAGPSGSGSGSGSASRRTNHNAQLEKKSIPAFLNKLRSMVDDPSTVDLIRWAEDGESFFVPNHVRFGSDVLPHFFKHNNFSSFVRQLNMYGFHKVPHLQQGALKATSGSGETELWEFRNDNFQRDRPDLMSMVQRKGKANQSNDQAQQQQQQSSTKQGNLDSNIGGSKIDEYSGALTSTNHSNLLGNEFNGSSGIESHPNSSNNANNASATGSGGGNATSDQLVQLTSLFSAVQSIQRAQRDINDDLGRLNSSNNDLWREAIESRRRSKKQQDTINKMLRFLAGVFGAQELNSNANSSDDNVVRSPSASTEGGNEGANEFQRKSQRGVIVRRGGNGPLLIGDREMAERQEQEKKSKGKSRDRSRKNDGTTPVAIEELELPYDQEDEMDDIPEHARARILEPKSAENSPRFGSPEARAEKESSGPRITQVASPPRSSSINSQLHPSSTPGGSRRLSSQASSQILNALASGEGSAWLASILGNNNNTDNHNLTSGSSRASTPGGGFKLDPKMLATLQAVLSSGGNSTLPADSATSSLPDYFGGSNNFGSSNQSHAKHMPSTPVRPSNLNPNGSHEALAFDSFSNPDINSLSNSSNSNALIQSPSNLSAFLSDTFNPASTPRPDTPNSLALSLSRATQNLQGINSDTLSVQDKINALVESLKLDPEALSTILNNNTANGNNFDPKGIHSHTPNANGETSFESSSGDTGGENDVDMDSLLKEFLNTNAPSLSNSEFSSGNTPSRSEPTHQDFSGNARHNWEDQNHSNATEDLTGVGDFAFSPNTSTAFLQNMANNHDFNDIGVIDDHHQNHNDNAGGTTVGSWGVDRNSTSNPPSDGANTGGTSTPVTVGSPSAESTSTINSKASGNGKKRKIPANFQGALGDEIQKMNAETRAAAKIAGLGANQMNLAPSSSFQPPPKKTRQELLKTQAS